MDTDWWDLVPDFHRTIRVPEPLLALDGRVFVIYNDYKKYYVKYTYLYFQVVFFIEFWIRNVE